MRPLKASGGAVSVRARACVRRRLFPAAAGRGGEEAYNIRTAARARVSAPPSSGSRCARACVCVCVERVCSVWLEQPIKRV